MSVAGPGLFDADYPYTLALWYGEGLSPDLVADTLMDGIEDSVSTEVFTEKSIPAWEDTIIKLIKKWGTQ